VGILVLISSVAYSRDIDKGTIAVSGITGLSFARNTLSNGSDVDTDFISLELNPEYYVGDNLGIGIAITYEYSKTEADWFDVEISSLLAGPQVVYNIAINDQVSAPVFFGVGYAKVKTGSDSDSGFAWMVGGGIRFFVVERVSFDGYVFFDRMNLGDEPSDYTSSDIGARLGISVYLGGE
jgi:opacity protein-like surface antigen